jgi:acylphosphatase
MSGAGHTSPDGSTAGGAPTPANARLHAFLSGYVQGVGMRWTVADLAESRGLTGWVRNLANGQVEIVAEGPRPTLEGFSAALQEQMSRYIRRLDAAWGAATGEFDDFRITH